MTQSVAGWAQPASASSSIIVAAVKCRPPPRIVSEFKYFQVEYVWSVGQEVECKSRRSRRSDAFGELRGRSGLPPSRSTRRRRLHQGAFGAAHLRDGCTDWQRSVSLRGRDIPQEWWALFKSPALNAVIERALNNNPSLQSAIATLRAANQAVYAQEGRFLPARPGELQSHAAVDRYFDRPGSQQRRQSFQPLHGAGRGLIYFRRLGPQSSHGGIAQGARRQPALPGRSGLSDTDVGRSGCCRHRGVAARTN